MGIDSSQHPCFLHCASTCALPLPQALLSTHTCSPCPGAPAAPLPSSPPTSPGWWVGGFPQFMDEDVKPLCFPHPSPSPGPIAAGSVPDCYNHFPALNYPKLPSHLSDTNYCKREGLMWLFPAFLVLGGEPYGLSHPSSPALASIPAHTGQRFPAMSRFPGKRIWLRLSTSLSQARSQNQEQKTPEELGGVGGKRSPSGSGLLYSFHQTGLAGSHSLAFNFFQFGFDNFAQICACLGLPSAEEGPTPLLSQEPCHGAVQHSSLS